MTAMLRDGGEGVVGGEGAGDELVGDHAGELEDGGGGGEGGDAEGVEDVDDEAGEEGGGPEGEEGGGEHLGGVPLLDEPLQFGVEGLES